MFHPLYTDLAPGQVYPDVANAEDLLASGDQPMSLVRALLERRFDYTVSYASALGSAIAFNERYASGYGSYEDNYFWKLDQVIAVGYRPAPGLGTGVLERRPGPDRAAVLASCFAPFQLGGDAWTIRHGGGFWCQTARGVIMLDEAPASMSELITKDERVASGTLGLTARPGASVRIQGGGGWAIRATRRAAGWLVIANGPDGRSSSQTTRQASLPLDLGNGRGLSVGPDPALARISILASVGSGVSVDLTRVRLRG